MSDDTDTGLLVEGFRRQLAALVTPTAIRDIEDGVSPASMWASIDETGFVDAMLPESLDGAGLNLAQAFPLVLAAGEYGVPLPFAETMIARAMLAQHDAPVPAGAAIVLAGRSALIPCAGVAGHALLDRDGQPVLVACTGAGSDLFRTRSATGIVQGETLATLPASDDAVLLASAAVASALMAGAMTRVMEMTLSHASDRQQFGRPLGKFQAIQQQLAVLAEQVLSAQVAARTAFSGHGFGATRVAAAKCRANEAATLVCNIAHAIHGAIGATAEFDLQLYTRRIKQWQLAFGSEGYWAERLGRTRIASRVDTTADFLRLHLATGSA